MQEKKTVEIPGWVLNTLGIWVMAGFFLILFRPWIIDLFRPWLPKEFVRASGVMFFVAWLVGPMLAAVVAAAIGICMFLKHLAKKVYKFFSGEEDW